MKHEAWRRDPAAYRWRGTIEPRWTDVDTLRHLNNSALQGLHLEARMRLITAAVGDGFWRARGPRLLADHLHTDFLLQAHYPQPLEAAARLTAVGEGRLTVATALFQDGQCVGLQTARLFAAERDRPVPLPAHWRQALGAGETLPEPEPLPPHPAPPPPDAWPQSRTLDSRYADLDATSRVAELALMRGAEVGRGGLLQGAFRALDGSEFGGGRIGTMVARLDLHRLHLGPPPAVWRLTSGVTHIGRSSVVVRVGFFDGDRCQALADCVQVVVERAAGTPLAMPAPLRAVFESQRLPPAPTAS
ncbi:MAG: hypothetical protein U1F56_04075 [Rubrivivax sp.]